MTTLVTMQEAARLLNCSRGLLYRLLRDTEFRSIKLGRTRRIIREDLEAYVQRQLELEERLVDEENTAYTQQRLA